jgi:hypothetical protein
MDQLQENNKALALAGRERDEEEEESKTFCLRGGGKQRQKEEAKPKRTTTHDVVICEETSNLKICFLFLGFMCVCAYVPAPSPVTSAHRL